MVAETWITALQEAYRIAYGSKLSDYHGNCAKRYDDRGLEVYSEAWGRVHACEELDSALKGLRFPPRWTETADPACHPVTLRNVAEEDALTVRTEEIKAALVKELQVEEAA